MARHRARMSSAIPTKRLLASRAHLPARDPRCDTVTVLNMAARRRPGRRNADMNAVAGKTQDWNLHYAGGPGANHFTHIVDARTGKLRGMTDAELVLDVIEWDDEDILRWRKNVADPGRRPKWVRPFTVEQRQRQARRRGVIPGWELKSPEYATRPEFAERFKRAASRGGGRWFVMTLVVMAGWARKLTNFHAVDVQTVLQAHGAPKPKTLGRYHPGVITAVSGRWAP